MKFKQGDRVIYTKSFTPNLNGMVGTVDSVFPGDVFVIWDFPFIDRFGKEKQRYGVMTEHIELYEGTKWLDDIVEIPHINNLL